MIFFLLCILLLILFLAAEPSFLKDFKFEKLGDIFAVYFVQDYYIGQVVNIVDKDSAEVDLLHTAGTRDGQRVFSWPRPKDIKEVPACCVFAAGIVLAPVLLVVRLFNLGACYEAFRQFLVDNEN